MFHHQSTEMAGPASISFPAMLAGLKAASEETRLRVLVLLAQGELSVTDLTDILGQSQPRISRHLRLMTEAGLLERRREGSWVFFRLARGGPGCALARALAGGVDGSDPVLTDDRARLAAVRAAHARHAEAFFARHAADWDRIRSLHVPEAAVEAAVLEAVGPQPLRALLDLGTGTGRMLALLGPRAERAVGVDVSPAMLAIARAKMREADLSHVELRHGDILSPPVERDAFDLVLVHQVLHVLDDPARAVREAARALRPGGRLLVVDFAPHAIEALRESAAHRRLGFPPEAMVGFFEDAGLDMSLHRNLSPPREGEGQLTVSIWLGRDRRVRTDWPVRGFDHQTTRNQEVA